MESPLDIFLHEGVGQFRCVGLEPSRHLLEPNALPDPTHAGGPMPADDFDALLRAARWTALSPYLDPGDNDGHTRREPIASPFHGGVRIESYQLVPLLKALRMPRVNLFIADDVGLGKTVEAGLILTELLLRRRIQRVLVLTPGPRCASNGGKSCGRSSHCGSRWSTGRGRSACAGGSAWTPRPGARSAASSPRITTCGSPTCWSSSWPPAARRKAHRIFPGIC